MAARLRSVPGPGAGGDAPGKKPTPPHRRRRARGPRGNQLALRGLLPKLALVRDRLRLEAEPPPPPRRSRVRRHHLQLPFILADADFPKGRVIERFDLSPAERARSMGLARKHLPVLQRPGTRAECERGVAVRPCPWVGCKHHLYLDVTNYTSVKVNFPGLEEFDTQPAGAKAPPWPELVDAASAVDLSRMAETCSLDVAEKHPEGLYLDEVGELMNLTMERIRQMELSALAKLRKLPGALEMLRQHQEGSE